MLSRVANSIYWMSRYIERADNVARFIDVNTYLMLDLSLNQDQTQWYPLVATSGDDEDFNKRYAIADEKSVVKFLTFDPKNPNSIAASIAHARENARTVREVIPVELWELINELFHLTQAHSRKRAVADLQDFYAKVRYTGHYFSGLMHNTMSRDQGFLFAHLGQMLERADKTARIMDVKYFLLLPRADLVNSDYDSVQWGAVLKSVSALEMYRQQYHCVNYQDVAQFVFFSPVFPRSLVYCFERAATDLAMISRFTDPENAATRAMARHLTRMQSIDATTVLADGLHEFIDQFQLDLNALDTAIHETFFVK
jgi:uncharacterized alpha-E superfamily protein